MSVDVSVILLNYRTPDLTISCLASIEPTVESWFTVLVVDNTRVRLGIRAPRHINVRRSVPDLNIGEANREAAVPPDPAEIKGLLSKAASEKNRQG